MAKNLKSSFEKRCRLCAEEQDVTIKIFSAEAQAMLLHKKLNSYLMIEVEENDKLPKNVCLQCCSKLQTVCEFIDKARNAQKTLLHHSLVLNDLNKNVLQAIKTENISEPEDNIDDASMFTGMEVSVDPMMVLQNSEESLSPGAMLEPTSPFTVEDVTHMHSVDHDNVTIKLIKKMDTFTDEKATDTDAAATAVQTHSTELAIKPFPCFTCKRSFFTELALKNHSWIHSKVQDDKPFKCSSCRESFDYKFDLRAHLKEHKKKGLCKLCGRCFRTERNLKIHMTGHLTTHKSYICKICGRSYNTKSNLKTHSITHSNERPYHCHLCKKSFKRNQDLKFHINQHTGEKPYKCPFCDKCFASSGNCYSHRNRMHPDKRFESKIRRRSPVSRENQPLSSLSFRPIAPKPNVTTVKGIVKYQCTMCDHSFIKRDNFTYHMYRHTGEKPFQCTFCEEKFVTRRGLLLHHSKAHPSKDRPLALLSKNVLLK